MQMAAAPPQFTPHVNQITRCIVTAAMRVHSVLGPGLLESAYQACLLHELRKQGFSVASQVGLPVVYDGEKIDLGYRIDLELSRSSALRRSIQFTRPNCFPTCA